MIFVVVWSSYLYQKIKAGAASFSNVPIRDASLAIANSTGAIICVG